MISYTYHCISLPSCSDRRAHMLSQCEKAEVDIRFFDGVQIVGKDVDDIAASEGITIEKFAERLTLGELGCYFSHRRLWQRLVDSDDDAYVILEDDMILEVGFKETVAALMCRSGDFDVVRLAASSPKMRRHRYVTLRSGHDVFWTKATALGTGCYTITKKAARALLKSSATVWGPVDFDIDRIWCHGQKVQMVYPVVARHNDATPSTIGFRVEDCDRHIGFHERWWRRGTKHIYRYTVLLQRIKSRRRALVGPRSVKP